MEEFILGIIWKSVLFGLTKMLSTEIFHIVIFISLCMHIKCSRLVWHLLLDTSFECSTICIFYLITGWCLHSSWFAQHCYLTLTYYIKFYVKLSKVLVPLHADTHLPFSIFCRNLKACGPLNNSFKVEHPICSPSLFTLAMLKFGEGCSLFEQASCFSGRSLKQHIITLLTAKSCRFGLSCNLKIPESAFRRN